ncbi:MAG: cytochrome c peroxidase, partial [Chitinophagaceae bacterium]
NNCISQYQSLLEKTNEILYSTIIQQIQLARNYLLTNNSFNKFDRLVFIKKYIIPLFASLTNIRDKSGIGYSTGLMPVKPQSENIFDTGFFNIDFFSPNERYRLTTDRIVLGRQLFFDPILSGNKKRSCATCHLPEKAFTDGLPTALSIDGNSYLSRNTPTLLNSSLQTKQFFDSRTSTLENQLSDVVHNSKEMKGSLQNIIPELKKSSGYISQFLIAYKNEIEPISQYNIANAIASYIRSLVALNAPFDKYMQGDESKMNMAEKNGFNLFTGKAKCATCHFIPLFNGLVPPVFGETESEVIGVPKTKKKNPALLDDDLGKNIFTQSAIHKHSFKTPTLRNIELTAPYMHNGIFNTLEEVMSFYNNGGGAGLKIAPDNQTLPANKLKLTKKEIADIIAFMKTLTDTAHIKAKYYNH